MSGLDIVRPSTLAEEPTGAVSLDADVIVVGSGAGGAVAALTLAEAGLRVVVVEEGFAWDHDQFAPEISRSTAALYQEGAFRTMSGVPPMPLAGGRALGGSTVVNSAICFRTPEHVVAEWNERTGGMLLADDYYRAQDEVEAVLGVSETPDELLSGYDRVHQEAARKMSWSNYRFRRNTPRCGGCGRCNQGCPIAAKRSADRAFLPRAKAAGARLLTGVRIDRVRPGSVEGTLVARDGAVAGSFGGKASRIVLAAGSVGTPRLLLDSGWGDTNPEIGAGLQVHPVFSVYAWLSARVVAAPGSTQGHYIDEFHDDRVILESNPTLPGALFPALPVHGLEAKEILARGAMTASTGAMVRDVGEGQISASRGAGDKVRYDIHPEDVARARRGMERAAQLWLEGLGADFVTLNLYGARLCRTMDEVRADLPADLHPNRLIGYSSHPQASCRLGRATDDAGEVRGVAGVHVADASALPCNVGRNPQVSVMTTARLLSERVARRMGKEPSPLWAGPGPLPAPIFQAGPCGLRATDGGAGGPAAGAEASP